jgi:hypothetical protein
VQRGEMTAENVVQLDDSFENAIKVTVN